MGGRRRDLYLLDGQVARARRIHLGLSQRVLAESVGVTQRVIWRLEHGKSQNEYDVAFIVDLTRELKLSPAQLLLGHVADVPVPGDGCTDADAAAVGATLAAAGDWVFVDDLAAALGWTAERTLNALEILAGLLAPTGQGLAWVNDREVCICGDADLERVVAQVTKRAVATWGLSETDAYFVFTIAGGGEGLRHRDSLKTLRRLKRAEIFTFDVLDKGRDDHPRLTELAKFNLCIDELDIKSQPRIGRTQRVAGLSTTNRKSRAS